MSEQEQDAAAGADSEATDGQAVNAGGQPSSGSIDQEDPGQETADAGTDLEAVLADVVEGEVDVTASEVDALDTALVERVSAADPEEVASELAALRMRVDALESQLETREDEVDDLESKLVRKQADFQNYKKRMKKRRKEEKERATEDLVERLLDVRDNLVRALDQEEAAGEDIRDGVETTLNQFDRVLAEENVELVEPEVGQAVDPHVHEVLMRVDSDQPADSIADVHRPGYSMADKLLRPAQVTVSNGTESAEAGSGTAEDTPDGDESVGAEDAGDGTDAGSSEETDAGSPEGTEAE